MPYKKQWEAIACVNMRVWQRQVIDDKVADLDINTFPLSTMSLTSRQRVTGATKLQ